MSRFTEGCIILAFMLSATPLGLAQQLDVSVRITIRVYNYANASGAILGRAEREASRIFQKAGIETVWLDCLSSPIEEDALPPCQRPFTPTDLILRILAERGSTRREFR